jgi:hypothetical protein
MSIPRSAKRSSKLPSDSGYVTYIITTRRIISGELLKYRNGSFIPQDTFTRCNQEIALTAAAAVLDHSQSRSWFDVKPQSVFHLRVIVLCFEAIAQLGASGNNDALAGDEGGAGAA